jgi:predicted metal-dependent HD superfamily phosphohydrolase
MTSGQLDLLAKIQEYISAHYREKVDPVFVFHNLVHTQEVVAACQEMAEFYKLNDDDRFALLSAAWFHDSGYAKGIAMGHEQESIRLATDFLQQHHIPVDIIQKVTACIEATHIPQSPASQIASILCDADLFHLGTEDFDEKNKLLRKELNNTGAEKISKKQWRKINIAFIGKHSYFTDYCREKLEPVKQKYLQEILKKVNGKGEKTGKEEKVKEEKKKNGKDKPEKDKPQKAKEEVIAAPETPVEKKKKEKDAIEKSERGISTMFRIMSNSQNTLSGMADSKANIMISVNSIIISIVLSGLLTVVIANPHLAIPFFLLIIVCVTTIVFSVLATRPKVTKGRFTEEDIHNKKVNLLFFGNFYKMQLSEYEWGMRELLNSRDYLYDSMIKDTYFLGIVLARKYKYLRYSYNIFMFGLILVMIAFALSILLYKGEGLETLG